MRFHRQFSYLWYDRLDRIAEKRKAQREEIEQHAETIVCYASSKQIINRKLLHHPGTRKKPTKVHLSFLDKDDPE